MESYRFRAFRYNIIILPLYFLIYAIPASSVPGSSGILPHFHVCKSGSLTKTNVPVYLPAAPGHDLPCKKFSQINGADCVEIPFPVLPRRTGKVFSFPSIYSNDPADFSGCSQKHFPTRTFLFCNISADRHTTALAAKFSLPFPYSIY